MKFKYRAGDRFQAGTDTVEIIKQVEVHGPTPDYKVVVYGGRRGRFEDSAYESYLDTLIRLPRGAPDFKRRY